MDIIETTTRSALARRRRLSNKRVAKMRAEMDGPDGLSIEAASEKYALPYFTVYQIRRGWTYTDAGGPVLGPQRRKRISPKLAEKMRTLANKGATIDQLKQITGYGRTAIKKALAGGASDE